MGWDEVAKTMEHAASLRRDGRATGFEIEAKNVTPKLAYVVQIEHLEAKVHGGGDHALRSAGCDDLST